ncbi:MAG: 4-hydroxy-tetrahydrodipicolinate reductase [Candidatus Hydrogenedens sp.]
MRICVAGALGKMGRRILEVSGWEDDIQVCGAFDLPESAGKIISYGGEKSTPKEITLGSNAKIELQKADVLIDFTQPSSSLQHAEIAYHLRKGIVIGTTGLSAEQEQTLRRYAQKIPIVYAPNMSVGVNLLFRLVKEVSECLGLDYNVEIVEIHHNQKKDSPSGTALRLAKEVADGLKLNLQTQAVYGREGVIGPRKKDEIGVMAVRGGDVVGEHTVYFIGHGERLQLTHIAHNRDNFARGAVRAARYVYSHNPGLYDMMNVLGFR